MAQEPCEEPLGGVGLASVEGILFGVVSKGQPEFRSKPLRFWGSRQSQVDLLCLACSDAVPGACSSRNNQSLSLVEHKMAKHMRPNIWGSREPFFG